VAGLVAYQLQFYGIKKASPIRISYKFKGIQNPNLFFPAKIFSLSQSIWLEPMSRRIWLLSLLAEKMCRFIMFKIVNYSFIS